ncbi:hypothetical protein CKA32_003363 [Geitlerinema sp. FC II]|nr:hypothetical protein CKA32_003363 [Geitlerinema sp. FC II]
MNAREINNFAGFTILLVILVLLTFGILQWLGIPTGNFVDWIVGVASFWWLVAIVTIPWNVYFNAKQVLADADRSRERGIPIDEKQIRYVKVVVRRSLWIALGLHVISALGLYLLAATGISAIGYISSVATLLFTGLRPAVAFYQYLAYRLTAIGREFKYPRQDIIELRERIAQIEENVKSLCDRLDPEKPDSVVSTQQRQVDGIRQDLSRLASSHETLKAENHAEHTRISRDAQNAIAQLSADAQFLDRVRELIRFFKEA